MWSIQKALVLCPRFADDGSDVDAKRLGGLSFAAVPFNRLHELNAPACIACGFDNAGEHLVFSINTLHALQQRIERKFGDARAAAEFGVIEYVHSCGDLDDFSVAPANS